MNQNTREKIVKAIAEKASISDVLLGELNDALDARDKALADRDKALEDVKMLRQSIAKKDLMIDEAQISARSLINIIKRKDALIEGWRIIAEESAKLAKKAIGQS